jgi:hypothetical protein
MPCCRTSCLRQQHGAGIWRWSRGGTAEWTHLVLNRQEQDYQVPGNQVQVSILPLAFDDFAYSPPVVI